MHLPKLCKNVVFGSGKEGSMGFMQTLILCVQVLCKVDYATDKFIHAPTFSYNEVMRLFELTGVGIVA